MDPIFPKLHLKDQKKSSSKVKEPKAVAPEKPKSPLRQASDRLVAASARLTNVTDDLSKLTSDNKPELPPRKGLLGRIFG